MKKWLRFGGAVLLGTSFLLQAACAGNSASSSSESSSSTETEENVYADLVDFVVDVEEGRDIRVLQITDPQLIDFSQIRDEDLGLDDSLSVFQPNKTEDFCYRYIRQVTEAYDPDLILVTGDIIYGKFDDNGSMWTSYIEFMESLNTPWAPVLGNHDPESKMGVDWQCEQLEKAENCLFKQRELTGNGNYTVGLTQGDKLQRVFFMLDSNGVGSPSDETLRNGHTSMEAGFGKDQIDWFTAEAKKITETSSKTKLSFAFHIQMEVFADALRLYTPFGNPTDLDKDEDAKDNGDFGYIGHLVTSGIDEDKKVWNLFKELGVDSVFVGHEHMNSCSIVYEGIRLQYGQKSSQYDQHNKIINGETVSDFTQDGTPILGGTKITLSKVDGKIGGDTGLILYK